MNRTTITALAIPALLAAGLGTALVGEKLLKLQFGTVRLVLPVPQGFCEPTGSMAALAKANASADPSATTFATLTACNRTPAVEPWQNYLLIKAPNGLDKTPFTKAAGLDLVEKIFSGPNSPKFDDAMTQKTADNNERAFGTRIEITGQFGYAGRDTDCVYLAGPFQGRVEGVDKIADGQIASCITVVGARMFSVNLHEMPAVSPIAKMKAQAHTIALSIHR